jgi:quercetin dioxygenase-like cupin family protein
MKTKRRIIMATESPIIASNQEQNVDERVRVLELDKAQPVDYDWGAIKWICDRKVTPDSLQSFGYAFVTPGKTNPEHRHMTCEEIIYMLAGELKVYAHGECLTLRPGQTALIPKGVRHKVVNEGWEPVVYIASFSAAFRDTVFKGQTGRLEVMEKLY